MSTNIPFWIFFGMYLIAMFVLAIAAMKKTTNTASFSIGNGDVGPIFVAITFAATFMSAATFVGMPGHAYQSGLSVLWFHAGQWFPCILSLVLLARAYRRFADKVTALSLPDWLGKRFHSPFLRSFTSLVTLLLVVQVGAQLAGVGAVFYNLVGVPYEWGVIIGIVIVMFYLTVGGTYAHIYTNVVQGFLMCGAGLLIFLSGFVVFGNIFSEVPAQLAAQDPAFAAPVSSYNIAYGSVPALFGIYLTHIWWTLNPHMINKFQYLKREKDIRKFILYTGVFIFVGALTQVSGLYTRALQGMGLVQPLANIDDAAVTYLRTVFPGAVAALLSVIVLAAVMSTTDGIMVYLSTVLGDSLYDKTWVEMKRQRGLPVDEERVKRISFRICQFGVIVVGLVGLPIALTRPPSISTLLWVGNGGIMGAVAGPIMLGLFCRRTSKQAAVIGSVCGFASFMILYFGGVITAVYLANAMGGLISVAVTAIFTCVLPPMPEEDVNAVFPGGESPPTVRAGQADPINVWGGNNALLAHHDEKSTSFRGDEQCRM